VRARRKQRPPRAAVVIQKAWRRFSQRRIFQYYRDLIKFREKGHPAELLRCINIRESQLCDAAAGIHVRFRLGGSTFPPLIFYKIFTHRPVTDICSFCPRDYAREIPKADDALGVHNHAAPAAGTSYEDFVLDDSLRQYRKPDGSVGWRHKRGWYRRTENNGWRPVVERALVNAEEVSQDTDRPVRGFSHLPQVRRQELIRRRKQKKRDWMAKLYQLGRREEEPAVGGAAACGAGAEDEEELLQWIESLDFDHYLDSWTRMATSNSTTAYIPQKESDLLEDTRSVVADSATLFAQNNIFAEPFKYGTGVPCVGFYPGATNH